MLGSIDAFGERQWIPEGVKLRLSLKVKGSPWQHIESLASCGQKELKAKNIMVAKLQRSSQLQQVGYLKIVSLSRKK